MESVADIQDIDCTSPYDLGMLIRKVRDFTLLTSLPITTTLGN